MKTRVDKDKQATQTKEDLLSGVEATVPPTKPGQLSPKHFSELRLLYLIIGSIFLAEVVAMFLIYELPSLPYLYTSLIDAGVMTILIFPVLYFLSFRPLTRHIEKRQQVERALQQKEELESRFFDSIHVLLAYMDRDFNFIRVNDAYAQADGQPPDTFIGKNHFDLFPDPENQRIFQRVVESGEPFLVYEKRYEYPEHPERGVTYWDWSLQPVKGGDGIVEGLVLSMLDVTDRKLAAEFVQKERQRFYDVLETLPAYVVLLTPDYHVSFANRVFSEHFGVSQDKRCYEHLFGRSEPCEICETYKVLKTMAPTKWEWKGPNGHIYDVFDYPFTDTDGSTLILEMGIDITERKRAEEANRQLSRIVEQTEDTVVVTDCAGLIEYVNPAFERLTGYTKEEVPGKTPRVIKSQVHDPAFYQNLWNTILKGEVFQSEIANCKKNGELFYEVKTITPLRDAQGSITHFVATGKDITEHKLDEEKLLRAYDELELRVEERTEELRITNCELEKEISERKQAEQALRQSAVMLRAMLEQMPSGVTVRDARTGKLVLSNVRSLEIMNALADIPEQFAEYRGFHPDGRAYQSEEWPVNRSMATGEVVNAEEIECERGDGTRFTIVVSSAPIYDVEGRIVSGVAVFHDITERKQTEAAVLAANEELKRFNQAMIGRELRMIELKKEVNELCGIANQPLRYSQNFETE